MTFDDIQKANEQIRTTNIKGKEYAEVHQRIKAFRMLCPEGAIKTELVSNENGVCVFKAEVYAVYLTDERGEKLNLYLLGTGYAYEKESSSYINKTSYIENCETSAVGRALAMCGLGIDTSIASAEELQNALLNQPLEKKYINALKAECKRAGKKPGELKALKGLADYTEITMDQFNAAMQELKAE